MCIVHLRIQILNKYRSEDEISLSTLKDLSSMRKLKTLKTQEQDPKKKTERKKDIRIKYTRESNTMFLIPD